MYYVSVKKRLRVIYDIMCNLSDHNHGNQIILEMLVGVALQEVPWKSELISLDLFFLI